MNAFQQLLQIQKANEQAVGSKKDINIPKEFTEEQSLCARIALNGDSICITGPAGTGKSFLLSYLVPALRKKHGAKKVHVSAATALAATHLDGATTVHATAGTGIDVSDINHCLKKAGRTPFWKDAKVWIIDEISMVTPEYFTALNSIGKRIRNKPNLPFGGIQIIVLGDFMQLPYIDSKYADKRKKDPSLPVNPPSLFDCKAWKETFKKIVLLTKVQRQQNQEFVELLQRARMGELTDEDDTVLILRMGATFPDNGIKATHIYTHKANVEAENNSNLAKLDGEVHTFLAEDGGSNEYAVKGLQNNCMAPTNLKLKLDAQVMLVKNIQPPHLVNGSRGRVVGFRALEAGEPEYPDVEFESGITMNMGRKLWEVKKGDVKQAFRNQVPLCLAWAITVHKCQGMSIDKACLDISRCFVPGQAYTGLSRVRTLEGLSLVGYSRANIKVNPRGVEWYASLGDVNAQRKDEELKEELLKSAKKKIKVEEKQKGNQWWNEYEEK